MRRNTGKQGRKQQRPRRLARAGLRTAHQIIQDLEISESTFQRLVRAGLAAVVQGHGAAPALYDPLVVAKFVRKSDDPSEEDEDEMMSVGAGNSINLEKYRKEKAREAKRRNDLAEGRLIEMEEVHAFIDLFFGTLRTEFEAMERVHGTAVGDWARQAIARTEEAIKAKLPKPEPAVPPLTQGTLAI